MAETTESAPAEQLTLEQELTTYLNPEETTPEEKPAEEAKTEETPAEVKTEAPTDIEKALAEIPDAPEVKDEEKPAVSPEQQEILAAFPNKEVAQGVLRESQIFQQLNTALQNSDYDTVEQLFDGKALEGFLEHIYTKHVASEEWINRWIAEKEGTAPVHKGMSALEQKLARLEAKLAEKDSETSKQSQQKFEADLRQSYFTHVDGVFNKFNFSPADRRYVLADISGKISSDPQLLAAYRSGNMQALNTIIKTSIRDYSTKDQVKHGETQKVLEKQEQKRPLIQGQAAQFTEELPSDVKQVPKDKLDQWQTQELQKLFRQ